MLCSIRRSIYLFIYFVINISVNVKCSVNVLNGYGQQSALTMNKTFRALPCAYHILSKDKNSYAFCLHTVFIRRK